ncbi:uncharacterized protein ACHE_20400S [Aspergillus chevalieri]|uniref:Uncharacterized protein n=1 Tax=Aspergillus chevalieri TaxID=182096 RepID=A0A7R7VHR7_ASPCH|nr:uncharacterized protein ACHE_20400S [Aspergillus chevalieri]BCR84942.1 hypothetical protein ACHE_20400S [Aspergillus chevalieri]
MHHHHQHSARYSRIYPRRPDAVPRDRIPLLEVPEVPEVPASGPTLVPRAPVPVPVPSSGSSESSTSGEKPTSTTTTTTLPVVLGAVVPIVCAIVILVYLHRRNVRRLRNEDANDKHKSLDFGMDIVDPPYKGMPMQEAEKGARVNHTKGLSLDVGHPYLMPPGLHGSQDSFNIGGEDDRYRHAVSILAPDSASTRSHPRGPPSMLSNAAPSTNGRDNAQKSMLNDPSQAGLHFDFPPSKSPSPGPFDDHKRHSAASSSDGTAADIRKSNSHLASAIHRNSLPSDPFKHPDEAEISDDDSLHHHDVPVQEPAPVHLEQSPAVPTPRISLPVSDAGSDYSNHRKTAASIPAVNISGAEDTQEPSHDASPLNPPPIPEEPQSKNSGLDPRRDTRRMTFGLRPLPPEDPTDNPEQRANRIRSFYKEYFEDSKTGRETTYYEDFGPEFYGYPDDMAHDPSYDDYYGPPPAPFAEPVTRRAMTPPPRAPPPFQPGGRHMPSGSVSGFSGFSSGFGDPGPRAMSSASNRMPMPGPPRAPRRPAPPPAPLNILPTPHMLKDDAIMGAIDFAPGNTFKDQREGRAETPLGGRRPFSPMTRAATPLASAFDELSVMPSPHALRKSGAYSNLDFAPPPRFKTAETASDAGSIRSNGTGLSNAQLHNIRTGAYRVSRLPTSTVGTKDDMFSELRPKWEMRT